MPLPRNNTSGQEIGSLAQAEDEITHGNFDVIVTDLVMEDQTSGLKVLELAKLHQPDSETIMVTAHGDVPTAKAALHGGAYEFIEKPLDLEVFRNLVNNAAETVLLRSQNADQLIRSIDRQYGFLEVALIAGHQSIGVNLTCCLVEDPIFEIDEFLRLQCPLQYGSSHRSDLKETK